MLSFLRNVPIKRKVTLVILSSVMVIQMLLKWLRSDRACNLRGAQARAKSNQLV